MKPFRLFFKTNKMKMLVLTIMTFSLMSFQFIMQSPLGPSTTGSPCDVWSCDMCHSDMPANSGPGICTITSNIPACGYSPGATYSITTTIIQPSFSLFQFQLSPQFTAGCLPFGTLTTNANTQMCTGNGFEYISALNQSSINTWTFDWTAPAAGQGTGTFYAAFCAADSDGTEAGDDIYTTSYTVSEGLINNLTLVQDTSNLLLWYGFDTLTGGTPPFTYYWDFGDGDTSNLALPSHTYAVAGTYTICLTLTDANGCTTTNCDTTFRIAAVGNMQYFTAIGPLTSVLTSIENFSQFSIYPNPFSVATIIKTNNNLHNATLTVYDLQGKTVRQIKNISGPNITLTRDNLLSGVYFIELKQGNEIIDSQKIILTE